MTSEHTTEAYAQPGTRAGLCLSEDLYVRWRVATCAEQRALAVEIGLRPGELLYSPTGRVLDVPSEEEAARLDLDRPRRTGRSRGRS